MTNYNERKFDVTKLDFIGTSLVSHVPLIYSFYPRLILRLNGLRLRICSMWNKTQYLQKSLCIAARGCYEAYKWMLWRFVKSVPGRRAERYEGNQSVREFRMECSPSEGTAYTDE